MMLRSLGPSEGWDRMAITRSGGNGFENKTR